MIRSTGHGGKAYPIGIHDRVDTFASHTWGRIACNSRSICSTSTTTPHQLPLDIRRTSHGCLRVSFTGTTVMSTVHNAQTTPHTFTLRPLSRLLGPEIHPEPKFQCTEADAYEVWSCEKGHTPTRDYRFSVDNERLLTGDYNLNEWLNHGIKARPKKCERGLRLLILDREWPEPDGEMLMPMRIPFGAADLAVLSKALGVPRSAFYANLTDTKTSSPWYLVPESPHSVLCGVYSFDGFGDSETPDTIALVASLDRRTMTTTIVVQRPRGREGHKYSLFEL